MIPGIFSRLGVIVVILGAAGCDNDPPGTGASGRSPQGLPGGLCDDDDDCGLGERCIDDRVCVPATGPRLNRCLQELPTLFRSGDDGVRDRIRTGGGEESFIAFEYRRRAREPRGCKLRSGNSCFGRSACVQMFAHCTGLEKFPNSRRLRSGVTQRMHRLVIG